MFHVDILTTLNEVWLNIESLFGNTNELRGHQHEKEFITLNPTHFEMIQDVFTKFKSMVLQLKQCGIENKEWNLIFSTLSNLGPEYSFFFQHFTETSWQFEIGEF